MNIKEFGMMMVLAFPIAYMILGFMGAI